MAVTTNPRKLAALLGASGGGIHTDGTLQTAAIKDDAVTTAKIPNDAVTLAKMAAGTDGQIITYDASTNPIAVGPGTDGQVLTSGGAGAPAAFELGGFASGTVMLFQQTAAPTGWTKGTTHTDKALRLTTGTVGTGGAVAFETAFASVTPAITNVAHTLATSEMPSHNHSTNSGWQTAYDNAPYNTYRFHQTGGQNAQRSATTVGATGGGGGHTHNNTMGAINLDVNFVDVIIASKD